MSITKTTTDLSELKINYLTQAMYDDALENDEINDDELYFTPSESLIDLFYPVGSYYQTSDSSFNPNTSWGGTWSLLGEGQVLLSAGSNYIAGQTYGNNAPTLTDAQVAHGHSFTDPTYTASGTAVDEHAATACTRTNNVAISNHTVTVTQPKTPALTSSGSNFVTSATSVGSYNRKLSTVESGGDYNYLRCATSGASVGKGSVSIASGGQCTGGAVTLSAHSVSTQPTFNTPALSHTVTQPTISVSTSGSVANLSGASSSRTAYSTMQASTAAYIWHRTA